MSGHTRTYAPPLHELRDWPLEQLLELRTTLAYAVATIDADLGAANANAAQGKPIDHAWHQSASFARDKQRAGLVAIKQILAERAAATEQAASELLDAATDLIEADTTGNDDRFDTAWARLVAAVNNTRQIPT